MLKSITQFSYKHRPTGRLAWGGRSSRINSSTSTSKPLTCRRKFVLVHPRPGTLRNGPGGRSPRQGAPAVRATSGSSIRPTSDSPVIPRLPLRHHPTEEPDSIHACQTAPPQVRSTLSALLGSAQEPRSSSLAPAALPRLSRDRFCGPGAATKSPASGKSLLV